MDSKSKLEYLLRRRHEKTITKSEEHELARLIAESSDGELTNSLRSEWEHAEHDDASFFNPGQSARMLENILARDQTQGTSSRTRGMQVMLQRLAAAAAVLVFVSLGLYLAFEPSPDTPPAIAAAAPTNDAAPAGNRATLMLSEGQTIILDNASNGLLAKQGGIAINKTKDGQLIYQVTGDTNEDVAWNTLATPRGGQYQIVLPDGSKIWLNAASSLKFPSAFVGKARIVELTGEAYFEVVGNSAMPFKVRSGNAEVEVLGTHFNIMAYSEESEMKTTLLEGSVKVSTGNMSGILKPGQQASLTTDGAIRFIDNASIDEAVAWKNGLFQFNDADLATIMREAARWYDLDIRYPSEVPQRRFTGRISRSVNASELLSILEYTGVRFTIEDKKIIVGDDEE